MEPMLRFKADDGSVFPDWEEMTLGDVGSVAMCKRVFKEQTREVGDVPFFKIGTFGGVPDAYISKSLFDELKSKYAYPEVGTILLSASGTIGRQVEYQGEDAYYQDSNIVWLEHDDTVLDSYLKQFYSVVKWQGLEGSTIKRLYNKTILDTPFYRPSLPEQRKIADLLSAVDDVISAQEAEVAAWEKRKKGVMQKLFSQEVRFKADDGSDFPDWEEKTLGELANLFTGKSFTSELSESGRYVVMDMGSVSSDGLIIDSKLTDSNRDLLRKGDLIMPKDDIGGGLIIGKTAYIPCDKKYVCGDHVYRLRFDNDIDALFMHYEINSSRIQRRLRRKVTGSAQLGLNSKSVLYEIVSVPSFPEQRKIADCLISLDDVIAKAKDELDAWRELKKGLLQQMFV